MIRPLSKLHLFAKTVFFQTKQVSKKVYCDLWGLHGLITRRSQVQVQVTPHFLHLYKKWHYQLRKSIYSSGRRALSSGQRLSSRLLCLDRVLGLLGGSHGGHQGERQDTARL